MRISRDPGLLVLGPGSHRGEDAVRLEAPVNACKRRIEVGDEHQSPARQRGIEGGVRQVERVGVHDLEIHVRNAEFGRPRLGEGQHVRRQVGGQHAAGRRRGARRR